ncbi:GTPase IMAP family member 8-like protein [Labeo rohita]|uniref:GTPase IMAP family member 8-like protein n=1 Tax=Labeo rohita TaxID=84645 RepID=A0A498NSU5_LABRO|nr:GTPase IMAP family member 8-like protein [Labeo rohita]
MDINITRGEIQTGVGILCVILPVLLNHTNNPDCEQSWLSESHFSREIMFRVRNQTVATPISEIQTPVGFLYEILPVLLNHTNNPDCEQSWYLQDKRLIADPSEPQRMIDPATAVKSDRLVTSHCVNLNHEIICDSTRTPVSRVTAYRVRNQTAVTPNSDDLNEALQHSGMSAISCSPDDRVIRILLMGRNASWKSSSGNTKLGENEFDLKWTGYN